MVKNIFNIIFLKIGNYNELFVFQILFLRIRRIHSYEFCIKILRKDGKKIGRHHVICKKKTNNFNNLFKNWTKSLVYLYITMYSDVPRLDSHKFVIFLQRILNFIIS